MKPELGKDQWEFCSLNARNARKRERKSDNKIKKQGT